MSNSEFRFRKNDVVGAPDAEEDMDFLEECFVNTGDIDTLRDPGASKRIMIGRTGSGKTALLNKLTIEEEHVIPIEPEALSLQYLSNSTILPYLQELGVDLDLFYRFLWRHIFSVELIRHRYNITSQEQQKSLMTRLFPFLGDGRRKRAVEYLLK